MGFQLRFRVSSSLILRTREVFFGMPLFFLSLYARASVDCDNVHDFSHVRVIQNAAHK